MLLSIASTVNLTSVKLSNEICSVYIRTYAIQISQDLWDTKMYRINDKKCKLMFAKYENYRRSKRVIRNVEILHMAPNAWWTTCLKSDLWQSFQIKELFLPPTSNRCKKKTTVFRSRFIFNNEVFAKNNRFQCNARTSRHLVLEARYNEIFKFLK